MAHRYAIYFAPAVGGALETFGAHILGVDASTGQEIQLFTGIVEQFPNWRLLVQQPARYGFHATLKAPFELACRYGERDLLIDVEHATEKMKSVDLGVLRVARICRFAALVARQPSASLFEFAGDIVRRFDHFRSPSSEHDRERRNPQKLTERQRTYLDRWGYPFVFDEFRFHMTLTGPVPEQQLGVVRHLLETAFRTHVPQWDSSFSIDQICVFKQQDRDSRFRLIARYALGA